jgi:hypothetical protein
MKKLALLAALSVVSVSVMADATIGIENYTANTPIFELTAGTAPTTDVFCQLLGNGSVVSSFTVAKADAGFFDNGVGVVAGAADNSMVNFEFRAWTVGTWPPTDGLWAQGSWSQATGSWNPAAVPPTPAMGPAGNFPSLTLGPIPEPSTIALGMLGAAALLLRRRK